MGTRPQIWIALNGVEFTPRGTDSPVCWPWSHVKVVRQQGFVLLDSAGERAKGPNGARMMVSAGAMHRYLGRLLQSRALREQMDEGKPKQFRCNSREDLWLAVTFGVMAPVCAAMAVWGHHRTFECWAYSIASIALSPLFLRSALRRNVDELIISGRGVGAILKDGRRVDIPWNEMEPRIRAGQFRSVNGIDLRFKHTAEIGMAVRAARRKTAGSRAARRGLNRFLRRVFALAVFTGALCGAAGGLTIHLLGLPPPPTPMWVFTRMTGFGVFIGGMIFVQVWLSACADRWLFRCAARIYSHAPRAPETIESPPA